jgi:CDP-diacylglycerol--inositol 3-phosphatidyltransferase
MFFIALYLLSFSSPLLSPSLLQQVPAAASINAGKEASGAVLKQIFTNPYSAGALELARANKMVRISTPS